MKSTQKLINKIEQEIKQEIKLTKDISGESGDKTLLTSISNKNAVLKIFTSTTAKHEIHCAKQATEHGLSPQFIYTDNHSYLVTDYINTVKTNITYQHIAHMLHTLHQSSCDFIKTLTPCERVAEFLSQTNDNSSLIHDELNQLTAILKPHFDLTSPCHFDLNKDNILFDGTRVYLIDWSDAVMSDPLYDLASHCFYHQFDLQEQTDLLAAYNSNTLHNRKKLYLLIEVACLMMMAWCPSKKSNEYQRAAQFLHHLKQQAFHQQAVQL